MQFCWKKLTDNFLTLNDFFYLVPRAWWQSAVSPGPAPGPPSLHRGRAGSAQPPPHTSSRPLLVRRTARLRPLYPPRTGLMRPGLSIATHRYTPHLRTPPPLPPPCQVIFFYFYISLPLPLILLLLLFLVPSVLYFIHRLINYKDTKP